SVYHTDYYKTHGEHPYTRLPLHYDLLRWRPVFSITLKPDQPSETLLARTRHTSNSVTVTARIMGPSTTPATPNIISPPNTAKKTPRVWNRSSPATSIG